MRVPEGLKLLAALALAVVVTGAIAIRVLDLADRSDEPGLPLTIVSVDAGPAVPVTPAPAPAPGAVPTDTVPSTPAAATPTPPETPATPPQTAPEAPPPLADPARAACFGAASADPVVPCENPLLAGTVFPLPQNARAAQRPQGCRRSFQRGLLRICFWGARVGAATRTVALIGDSHASHWRAALKPLVASRRWRAISISRAGCPMTLARADLPGPERKAGCLLWNQQVQRWVADHPSVSTIFVGAHRGSVLPDPGLSMRATQRLGYLKAWRQLLAGNVRQIVVIRGTPRIRTRTLPCIQRALAERRDPGGTCALPRSYALRSDPAVEAARLARTDRVQVADLSRFFCDEQVCRPVVGGALVLRDVSHMTTTFSATLGPYLQRTVRTLSASWR